MKRKPRTTTALHRREREIWNELSEHHHYVLADRLPKNERESMIFVRRAGKQTLIPATCIKLIVPTGSDLGQEIVAYREIKAKKQLQRIAARRR